MALTRRQKQVLDFLEGFINHRGYSPSFEEIGRSLKLSSLATVHKHVENLERKGFIRRGYNRSRSIDVVAVPGEVPFAQTARRSLDRSGAVYRGGRSASSGRPSRTAGVRPVAALGGGALDALEFPLLGRIAAGQPVEAVANPETLSLGDFARGKSNIFVLRVKGDSMVDDHICDGDYILVEGTDTAENGEIVVALIEGTDATLKRFFRQPQGRVRLQPANAQMEPIVVAASDVKIQGKVIGVLRKY
ncbi:MAG TPA: transcriptional repressor LexA [Terriglobia bacterium]|nr:transcriptional repressor LexA [Terriglobia bacterium]